jgi:Leucine-rich repeat (LRR) protein
MDLPPNLKTLEINCECEDEVCLKPLSKLTNLEKLTITANKANNIEVLKSLSKLKDLTIMGNIRGDSLSGLTSLTRLEMTLDDHPKIDFVSSLKELKVATVEWNVLFYHTSCNKVT